MKFCRSWTTCAPPTSTSSPSASICSRRASTTPSRPSCRPPKVRKRIPQPEGVEVLIADMTVAYRFVRETFTSRVTLDRPNLQILVEYLQGPFSRLENRWAFHPTGEQTCEVEFFISYDFKSRTLALLMGAMFDDAFRRFTAAFERRADVVYAR